MAGTYPRTRAIRRLAAALVVLLAAGCHAPSPGPDRVFVSDEEANVLHVIDGRTGRVERTLQSGARPRGLALSPDRNVLYVAAGKANRFEAWDARRLKRLRLIASGSDPERLAISPDGTMIYAANEDRGTVSFIDAAAGKVVREVKTGPEPEGVGISPDGKLLIATSEVASVAQFIDAKTGKVLADMPVGSRPRDVLFLKHGREAWVSSEQRGTIHVFDTASRQQTAVIDLAAAFPDLDNPQAVEMEVTRDGRRAFVAMGRADRVAEIAPATLQVLRWFPTGHRTWGISLSPDETRLYAASGLSGTVTIVDLVANRVARTVKLGGKPWTTQSVAR